jgi:hypothetical protein
MYGRSKSPIGCLQVSQGKASQACRVACLLIKTYHGTGTAWAALSTLIIASPK